MNNITKHLHRRKTVEIVWMALFIVVPFIYSRQIYDGALLPKLLTFQVFTIFLFGVCLKGAYEGRLFWKSSPLFLPLSFYIFFNIISIVQSINIIESMLRIVHYIGFFFLPILVFYTLNRDRLLRIFQVASWIGLPVALIGLGQYFGWNIDLFGWNIQNIPSNANPSATFFHRNAAAEYLIGILPLAWIGFQLSRTPTTIATHAGLLTLLGTFLIYTRTRGAWVGLTVAILITSSLAFLSRKGIPSLHSSSFSKLKRNFLFITVLLICLTSMLQENIQKTGNQPFDEKKTDLLTTVASITSESGHRGRLSLWRHTLRIILDHPFFGVGLGNWKFIYPTYAFGDQVNKTASPIRPHNDLLWIASEIGLLGLLAYLFLLMKLAGLFWDLLRVSNLQIRTISLGLSVLILAHLGDGMFNFPQERVASALCFWFSIGGIACLHSKFYPSPMKENKPLSKTLLVITSLATLLLLASFSISYKWFYYDWHHLRAFMAERIGDWPTASLEAERAEQYGDFRARTFVILGQARARVGDLSGAEIAYKKALYLHPNYPHTHNNLGNIYRRMGHLDLAVQAFQKALQLYPGFPEALNNLGNVYRDQGHLEKAIEAYLQATKGLSVPQVYYNLGFIYHLKGNILLAQENYLQALKQDSDYVPARRALSNLGVLPQATPGRKIGDEH